MGEWAREAFGARLTSLLLCGLGERKALSRRTLLIKPREGAGAEEVRLNIYSNGLQALPSRNHPLVLLAVLKLWRSRGPSLSGIVPYSYGDLYEALGWEPSGADRAAVDEAILRYFGLTYEPVRASDAGNSDSGLADSPKYTLVTSYHAADEFEEGRAAADLSYREVCINTHVLDGLRSRRLFGVDWDRVVSIDDAGRHEE
jgi:hypothetical protein